MNGVAKKLAAHASWTRRIIVEPQTPSQIRSQRYGWLHAKLANLQLKFQSFGYTLSAL